MSDLQARFEQAAEDAKQLPKRPNNETLLRLYALYKQATTGNVRGKRPGMMDFTGRAKHDAWKKLKGTTKEDAMRAYVELVEKLQQGS